MLMTGSMGMLASTLPVQWLLPLLGWRGLFWALAGALALSMLLMLWLVPRDAPRASDAAAPVAGYGEILRHPLFLRLAPLAFMQYGGMIAVQSLWAGPWLTVVGGRTPAEAAGGLFAINLSMLLTFLSWGVVMPRLAARGVTALQVLQAGVPVVLLLMLHNVWAGASAGPAAWALWCVSCTSMSLSQPALAQAFAAAQAGRALSAYNLLIFAGVFCVQWGIGLAIDALQAAGWPPAAAFRIAFAGFGGLCAAAYAWFLWRRA
jgi:predicted MFS family arabinose efflux permease